MSKLNSLTVSCVAVASSFALLATSAMAGDSPYDVYFSYSEDELQSADGLEGLYDRINSKATKSCIDTRSRDLAFQRTCTEDLVDDFVAGINNRDLDAIHGDEVEFDRYSFED